MSAMEMQEWETYSRLEPFPEDRIIHALAIVAATFANGYLKSKDSDKTWSPEDFIPKYVEPEKKKQTAMDMKALLLGRPDIDEKEIKKAEQEFSKFAGKFKTKNRIPKRLR